jgi:hypothetical protein
MSSDDDDDDHDGGEEEEGNAEVKDETLNIMRETHDNVIVGDQTSLEGAIRLAINHHTDDNKNGDRASFVTSGSVDVILPDILIDYIGELLLPANAIVAQVKPFCF